MCCEGCCPRFHHVQKDGGLAGSSACMPLHLLTHSPVIAASYQPQPARLLATSDTNLQVFLLVSASQAFLLNLCIFWCTTTNSPLATTVTGAHKEQVCTTARSCSAYKRAACCSKPPGTVEQRNMSTAVIHTASEASVGAQWRCVHLEVGT